jgi:YrbI family 3-deoxy-D-manno-octulosonate 8-phosphate phosphatase
MQNNIKVFLSDCDGVLTDGKLYYTAEQKVMKVFHVRDGMGFKILQNRGVSCGIITGDPFGSVTELRAQHLNLDILGIGIKNKLDYLERYLEKHGLIMDEVAFIGDDINDLELLQAVGLSACPADAEMQVINAVDYVCERDGGQGCVREFINYLISQITKEDIHTRNV